VTVVVVNQKDTKVIRPLIYFFYNEWPQEMQFYRAQMENAARQMRAVIIRRGECRRELDSKISEKAFQ